MTRSRQAEAVHPKRKIQLLRRHTMKQSKFATSLIPPRWATSWPIRGSGAMWLALAAMLILLVPTVWGQDNATLTGFVNDPSGAVVPNASITLTNTATGQSRETVSNASGSYRFANVGIGNYNLNITAQGFQKYSKTGIVINVAQSVEQDAVLAVGSQAQTVTVNADALQVQTESSDVSTLISGAQVEQLATNGRNITSLAALGLGVSNNSTLFGGATLFP